MTPVGRIDQILHGTNLILSLTVVGAVIVLHGFPAFHAYSSEAAWGLRAAILFYAAHFLRRGAAAGDLASYARHRPVETCLLAAGCVDLLLVAMVRATLGADAPYWPAQPVDGHSVLLPLHGLVLWIAGVELGRRSLRAGIWGLPVPVLFLCSYAILIVFGTCLLMLPGMSTAPGPAAVSDALFSAVSAACVTGLVVVDTGSYWSQTGHFVLLALIQLGGLNILVFATYFLLYGGRAGDHSNEDEVVRGYLSVRGRASVRRLVTRVLAVSFAIELVGWFAMYVAWDETTPRRAFEALFHTVSAFNNAGLSLFDQNLADARVARTPAVHAVVASLVVLGGLGFHTLWALVAAVRDGTRSWSSDVRWALRAALFLVPAGAVGLFLLRPVGGESAVRSGWDALFLSISSRTAGFNIMDTAALGTGASTLVMCLMFVGAAPGSTGGGVKTSTITTLLRAVPALLFRREQERTRSREVRSAAATIVLSAAVAGSGFALLVLLEPALAPLDLAFEAISAFGTVGLSRGVTAQLSHPGRWVLIALIVVGRLGPMTLLGTLLTVRTDWRASALTAA